MKNIIIAGFALLILMYLLRGKNEPFVNEAIFNEVEIPDASKDPYYQFIKNMEFPCMCSDGKENLRGQCVPVCPAGQTRFTNDLCYPPCPAGQSRHTNAVCYPPCPLGEFRDPAGVCQCNPQLTYDFTPNADVPGNDLGQCLRNHAGGVWPAWANEGKARCDNNPNCKAYNLIHSGGAWGGDWGSCMKTTSAIPTRGANKIDYYRKIDTVRNSSGVCVAPCPAEKTRDANGICQWNPCPAEQTRDANGICQWNACPADQTRDANGVCQCIQRPSYEVYNRLDVPGFDIGACSLNVPNIEGCKLNCDNNPNCKAYNVIEGKHCCLKTTSAIPTSANNNINYYRKFEGTLVKGSDGVCRVPCPPGKSRDANNICQWPPCPANSTVNETTGQCTCNSGYEVANAFSYYATSDKTSVSRNQRCDLPCAPGVIRDLAGVCGGSATISIPGLNFSFGQR